MSRSPLRYGGPHGRSHVESKFPSVESDSGFGAMHRHLGADEATNRVAAIKKLERKLECQCKSGLPILSKKWIGPKQWIGFCKKCKPK